MESYSQIHRKTANWEAGIRNPKYRQQDTAAIPNVRRVRRPYSKNCEVMGGGRKTLNAMTILFPNCSALDALIETVMHAFDIPARGKR